PDLFVRGALLGACRNHGNVELKEIIAKHVSELEPKSAGSSLLISNLYADNGMMLTNVLFSNIKKRLVLTGVQGTMARCIPVGDLLRIGTEEIGVLIRELNLAKRNDLKAVRVQEEIYESIVDVEPIILDATACVQDLGRNFRVEERGMDISKENRARLEKKQKAASRKMDSHVRSKDCGNFGGSFEETHPTIESYVIGKHSLKEHFFNCLIGVESLSTFFIEGHRTMHQVINFHAMTRLMALVPLSRSYCYTRMQIKRRLLDVKPQMLGKKSLANEHMVSKNIEKELTAEKVELEIKLEKMKVEALLPMLTPKRCV
ncbi:hypothetical protein GIB67_040936, partial [Kingdonia uniflora]